MTYCRICDVVHETRGRYNQADLRIFITTFPKCGTNLITQFFNMPAHITVSHEIVDAGVPVTWQSTNHAGVGIPLEHTADQLREFRGVAFSHLPYEHEFKEALDAFPTKIIFLIRDPKDAIVSHKFHAEKRPNSALNYILENGKPLHTRDDPIMDLIVLGPDRWLRFLPWLDLAHVVKFEDLIQDRVPTLQKIQDYVGREQIRKLGLPDERGMLRFVRPTKSPTFRRGTTGDWKLHFNTVHQLAYKEVGMLDVEKELGYEHWS